jgi:hypothetical protein
MVSHKSLSLSRRHVPRPRRSSNCSLLDRSIYTPTNLHQLNVSFGIDRFSVVEVVLKLPRPCSHWPWFCLGLAALSWGDLCAQLALAPQYGRASHTSAAKCCTGLEESRGHSRLDGAGQVRVLIICQHPRSSYTYSAAFRRRHPLWTKSSSGC